MDKIGPRQPSLPFDDEVTAPVVEWAPHVPAAPPTDSPVAFVFIRSPRARRYILRLRPDGVVRVTIPARGSKREALQVIERHRGWIDRQWRERMIERRAHEHWVDGTRILFRGEEVMLRIQSTDNGYAVAFADEQLVTRTRSVRAAVEGHLRELAEQELEPLVRASAAKLGLIVKRVTVRNQRTRWGSCSRDGNISLNWRLVQMPTFVCEYIVLHELMHLKQANHSRRFWREVQKVCPEYRVAEAWLRRHGRRVW